MFAKSLGRTDTSPKLFFFHYRHKQHTDTGNRLDVTMATSLVCLTVSLFSLASHVMTKLVSGARLGVQLFPHRFSALIREPDTGSKCASYSLLSLRLFAVVLCEGVKDRLKPLEPP